MSELQGGHNSNVEVQHSVGVQAQGDDEAEDQFSYESEKVYVRSGNKKKTVLYLLCIGLRAVDDSESLFCLDREPWLLLPNVIQKALITKRR